MVFETGFLQWRSKPSISGSVYVLLGLSPQRSTLNIPSSRLVAFGSYSLNFRSSAESLKVGVDILPVDRRFKGSFLGEITRIQHGTPVHKYDPPSHYSITTSVDAWYILWIMGSWCHKNGDQPLACGELNTIRKGEGPSKISLHQTERAYVGPKTFKTGNFAHRYPHPPPSWLIQTVSSPGRGPCCKCARGLDRNQLRVRKSNQSRA